jgi:hypothetical protein
MSRRCDAERVLDDAIHAMMSSRPEVTWGPIQALIEQDGRIIGMVRHTDADGRIAVAVEPISPYTMARLQRDHRVESTIEPTSPHDVQQENAEMSADVAIGDDRVWIACPNPRPRVVLRDGVAGIELWACGRKSCEVCGARVRDRYASHLLGIMPATGNALVVTDAAWASLSRRLRERGASYATVPMPDGHRAVIATVEMPGSQVLDSATWLVDTLRDQDTTARRRYSTSADWAGWAHDDPADDTDIDPQVGPPNVIALTALTTRRVLDRLGIAETHAHLDERTRLWSVTITAQPMTVEWHRELFRNGLAHRDTARVLMVDSADCVMAA